MHKRSRRSGARRTFKVTEAQNEAISSIRFPEETVSEQIARLVHLWLAQEKPTDFLTSQTKGDINLTALLYPEDDDYLIRVQQVSGRYVSEILLEWIMGAVEIAPKGPTFDEPAELNKWLRSEFQGMVKIETIIEACRGKLAIKRLKQLLLQLHQADDIRLRVHPIGEGVTQINFGGQLRYGWAEL